MCTGVLYCTVRPSHDGHPSFDPLLLLNLGMESIFVHLIYLVILEMEDGVAGRVGSGVEGGVWMEMDSGGKQRKKGAHMKGSKSSENWGNLIHHGFIPS